MFSFAAMVRSETGFVMQELNLGGGLGVRYVPEDDPPSIESFVAAICDAVKETASRFGFELPSLAIEPGRSIVGEAGTTLYTIGVVKEIPKVRTYVSVDGGMSDNPRPALYGARYFAVVANKADRTPNKVVTVAGKHCESDILIRDIALADPEPGDILAVFTTGAYHYSMASNYNRFPRPAVVFVKDGKAKLVVRRETYDDLLKCDQLVN
jgi:diaminopimelate decarboxylase